MQLAVTVVVADRANEGVRVKRLGHVFVRTAVFSALLADLVPERRKHDNWDARGICRRAQLPAHLKAVGVGEHHVEQDESGFIQVRVAQRILTARRGAVAESREFHVSADERADLRIIVDDQNMMIFRFHTAAFVGLEYTQLAAAANRSNSAKVQGCLIDCPSRRR